MRDLTALIFIAYLLTGIGVSTSMKPTEAHPKGVYLLRIAIWPALAGCAITEHRQLVRETRQILHEIATRTAD